MNQANVEAVRHPVATRFFRTASGSEVVVTIYQPDPVNSEQWKCDFTIVGLPEKVEASAPGVDSLQALEMAFQGVRAHLEQQAESLTWLDGEPGYLGIAKIIPDSYGTTIEKHLAKVLEDELARLLDDARRKGRPQSPEAG
jgi:hypothetical protein